MTLEEKIKNCNNLKQLREKVGSKQDEVALSLKLCTDLLNNIFKRLELKEKVLKYLNLRLNINYKISGRYYFLLTVHLPLILLQRKLSRAKQI